MSSNIAEASPTKAVVAELENLHLELRNEAARYVTRLDSEIERVRLAVEAGSSAKSLSSQRIRDLRDMLTILRQGQTKGAEEEP